MGLRLPSRREMLSRCANGFGSVALTALLAEERAAVAGDSETDRKAIPHHPAKAKNIIFLYMDGGPSQVDTFDYKPHLKKYDGQNPAKLLKVEPTQFANVGNVMASPWKFERYGQSGRWISDLFPNIAECADDLAFVHSMVSKFSEHTSANYFLHTGSGIQGRPSWGAWTNYGLGSGSRDIPGFLILNGGLIPPGGLDNFNSGFLPAAFQGSVFRAANPPVSNIRRQELTDPIQRSKLDLIRKLDEKYRDRVASDAVESAIANFETAYRMQTSIPELMDIGKETEATRKLYGVDAPYGPTKTFATQCLLARRLVERGARFIELTCPNVGADRWDQHSGLKVGHANNCLAVDRPIAGLLKDLKARGMFENTLIVWGGEFGRTPFAQGGDGRDHNPYGFTMWFAGAGIKAGATHGETDEWGYKTVRGKVEIHDLHATMLHLLGIDHKRLTFRFGGRDMRLTDVHGEVVREILS